MTRTRAVAMVATFSVVFASVIVASGGVASAVPSADISASETTNGVTSVTRTGTVEVFGTANNNGPSAVRITSNYHVSEGTIVAFNAAQGTCTQLDPSTVRCNSGVLNSPGASVATNITVKPTSDLTKHHVEITFTGGPQVTDLNESNNKKLLTLKLIG